MGLLGASAGMLAASGPSRMPISFTQALGQGMQGGLQGFGQGIQLQRQQQQMGLLEQQIAIARLRAAKEAQAQDMNMQITRQIFGGGSPAGGGMGGGEAPAMSGGGAPPPISASRIPVQQGPLGGPLPESSDGEMERAPGVPDLASMMRQPQAPQQPASQPAAQGGDFLTRASPSQLMWLEANGYKGALEAAKYAQQGVSFEPGKTYKLPNGQAFTVPILDKGMVAGPDGRVSLMPGFSGANAQVEGDKTFAQERARAGFNTAMIPTRDGGSVPAFQVFGGPMPGQGGGAPGLPGGGALGGQTPGDKTYSEAAAKDAAQTYGQLQEAGRSAPGQIAKYQQLNALLSNHDGGKLSQTGLDIASAANSLGIKLDKNLGNKEAAAALANEMALQLRNPAGGAGMPGAMSDSDRQFLASMIPSLQSSAQGRNQMVQMRVQMLKRDQEVSQMANKWQQRFGRFDAPDATGKTFQDYLAQYSEARPLFAPAQQ